MAEIVVLCERVRVEEKQLISAFADRELQASPLPPATIPGQVTGAHPAEATPLPSAAPQILVDRCANRSAAGNLFSLLRNQGRCLVDGGLASYGSRLDVVARFADTSIPTSPTSLVISEAGGMTTVRSMNYPCTLFPMTIGRPGLPIADDDIAEAALEHRHTIGSAGARSLLAVLGAPTEAEQTEYVVIDGVSLARSDSGNSATRSAEAAQLAIRAASVLNASALGVTIAAIDRQLVVWDVSPNPEFRHFVQIGNRSVAIAVADLVLKRITEGIGPDLGTTSRKERGRDILVVA